MKVVRPFGREVVCAQGAAAVSVEGGEEDGQPAKKLNICSPSSCQPRIGSESKYPVV